MGKGKLVKTSDEAAARKLDSQPALQISSIFHFSDYLLASPPTGTILKINKPQQSVSINEWVLGLELAGWGAQPLALPRHHHHQRFWKCKGKRLDVGKGKIKPQS
jgi:hypothetical protein